MVEADRLMHELPALKKLCQKARIPLPKSIEIKDPFWYVYKGSKVGGIAVYKKHGRIGGDPEYRKKKWHEWWEREGKFKKHPVINVCAPINFPRRSSRLAEFVGIILGDGGLMKKQVAATLNRFDDRNFVPCVKNLIQELFAVRPSICERRKENTVSIVISRTKLVQFFVKMGLCIVEAR